jgi:hypothetical protein
MFGESCFELRHCSMISIRLFNWLRLSASWTSSSITEWKFSDKELKTTRFAVSVYLNINIRIISYIIRVSSEFIVVPV